MNKLCRVFVALAIIASTIVVPHALAQRTTPPPSDAKLMHDVEAVLQNEKAFRGLTIVPKTSRGIVTLTGTVSSERDKVLAGLEVANVDGVKTSSITLTSRRAPRPKDIFPLSRIPTGRRLSSSRPKPAPTPQPPRPRACRSREQSPYLRTPPFRFASPTH